MKLLTPTSAQNRSKHGSSVVVILAMLTIMMVCVALNTLAMRHLGQELKLVEKKQVLRLQRDSFNHAEPGKQPD
jgi:hypothetical protein